MKARVLLAALLVCYPLIVYLGLQLVGPRWIAVFLLSTALVRWILNRRSSVTSGNVQWLLLAAALATAVTLLTGSLWGLKLYPVLINGIFLIVFLYSLYKPPTVIERFARFHEPDLPVEGVVYTRKVTWVWCIFFMINGSISAYTMFASVEIWTLYNGLISYLLIGTLMAGEFLVRRVQRRKHRLAQHD